MGHHGLQHMMLMCYDCSWYVLEFGPSMQLDFASLTPPLPCYADAALAWQSSTDWDGIAVRVVDNRLDTDYRRGNTCTHTREEERPWLVIDMGEAAAGRVVRSVTIWNRGDCCAGNVERRNELRTEVGC
jgi:hypothetical protein